MNDTLNQLYNRFYTPLPMEESEVDAAGAGVDAAVGCVNQLHFMPGFFCSLTKGLRQHTGGTLTVGTAQQQNNFHLSSSFQIFWFPVDQT